MALVQLVPSPLLNPPLDKTPQTIPSTAGETDPSWTKIRIAGENKFLFAEGRSSGKLWISCDNVPDDQARLDAIAEVAELSFSSGGTQAQRIARLEANGVVLKRNLLWDLKYKIPTFQFRVTRWDGTSVKGNFTLRDARVVASIGDLAMLYVFELYTDKTVEHSIEVRHNAPFAIDLNERMLDVKHEAL